MADAQVISNSHGLTMFSYNPLPPADASQDHTRVFELLPGSFDTRIQGNLVVVPLNLKSPTKSEYECLSYTWGSASDTAFILVNGERMRVSQSLDTALRRFRLTDRVRTLWIDAICIDQANNEEKSEQVMLMQHIYENAIRVLVWLGEAGEGSERAFALFRRLLTSLGAVGLRKWRVREGRGHNSEPQLGEWLPWENNKRVAGNDQYYHSPLFESMVSFDVFADRLQEWLPKDAKPHKDDHVSETGEVIVPITSDHQLISSLLLARPLFRRAWIIQEIAVAKEALVCCGADELDWWLLHLALCYLMTSAFRAFGNEAGLQRLANISTTRQNLQGGALSLSVQPVSVALSMFHQHRGCGTTDKRDKVYALLGLLRRMGAPFEIPIDYSCDTRTLYIRVACLALESTRTLDILAVSHGQDDALPSWVPDWSDDTPQPNLLFPFLTTVEADDPSQGTYSASASSKTNSGDRLSEDRLLLRGYQHDNLDRVGGPFGWVDQDKIIHEINHAMYEWSEKREENLPLRQKLHNMDLVTYQTYLDFWKAMREWHEIGTDETFDPYPFTGDAAESVLIRTLEGNYLPNGIDQPAKHWKHLWSSLEAAIEAGQRLLDGSNSNEDRRIFLSPAKLPGIAKDWDAPLYGPGNRRCLTRTRLGYLALVGREAREGDSIVLLQGGRTPYVARRKGEEWTLICDAYVHGIMYGEAWNAERCEEMCFI